MTPCHGEPLRILTTWDPDSYSGSGVEEIACPADGCLNSWAPDGTVVLDAYWNPASATPTEPTP